MFNKKLEKRIDGLEQQFMELKNYVPQINSVNNTVGFSKSTFANDDDKKKAAYALNLVTVSVSQIVDYEDLIILEQEYDAILNNINLENIIHDEPLLEILKQILDVITFFKIQAREKEFVERKYQQKMKNAIWSAVPNIGLIVAGGNPVTMAISLASQIGIGYMNYRKEKANSSLEKDEQMWQLEKSAIEQLNGLRRELFATAWKLADRYKFSDEYRLTEKQIDQYNKILMDNDPLRRFERLDVIKKDFEAFPPFWYNLGHTAKEISDNARNENAEIDRKNYEWVWNNADYKKVFEKYKEKALESYKKFDEIYIELMREDAIYSTCILEQIPLLIDNKCEPEKIKELLGKAIKLAGNNFDILQQTALVSLYLNDNEAAKNTLRRLVNEDYNTVFNVQLLSKIYINEKNRAEYKLLSERVESSGAGNYLLPYPEENESDENPTKEFYEQQKTNLKMQLREFFNRFIAEARIESLRLIPALTEESDSFFKEDNFLEIAKRKIGDDSIDGLDLLENYVQLLNKKCESLLSSNNDDFDDVNIDKIFKNDTEKDGDTIEEVADLISAGHINEIEKAMKNGEKFLDLLNWDNNEKTSPAYLFNQYCEFICEKILKLEVEQSDGNPLSDLDSAISKLYMAQGWAIPYYDKTNRNDKNNTKALIVSNLNPEIIEEQKLKKKKNAFIESCLESLKVEKSSIIQNRKQIESFINKGNKKLYETIREKYNSEQPVAIIKAKKNTAFMLFADCLWYFNKDSWSPFSSSLFCFQYSYKSVFDNYELTEKEFTVKASPEKFIIENSKGKKIRPILTSDDVNIEKFENMVNELLKCKGGEKGGDVWDIE